MYLSERVIFVVGVCVGVTEVLAVRLSQGCTLDVNVGNTKFQPLLLYNHTTYFELVLPEKGKVNLNSGKKITLICPGKRNYLTATNSNSTYATCVSRNVLEIIKNNINFDNLQCKNPIKGDVKKTRNKCANGRGYINDIGYQVTRNGRVTLIRVCYDDYEGVTFYTEHILHGKAIKYSDKVNERPSFSREGFELFPSTAYKKVFQKGIFNSLLTSAGRAENYINNGSFIVRGHLSPSGDFLSANTKRSTYYYINACPQWQIINGGNWKSVESKIRKVAESYNRSFQIITGTYGVLSLPDINNNLVPIYLVPGEKLPVPALIWKIIYDLKSHNGIAIITVNNPFQSPASPADLICQDICSQYGWYTSENWSNATRGFVYCCDLNSFLAIVKTAPYLTVRGILHGMS